MKGKPFFPLKRMGALLLHTRTLVTCVVASYNVCPFFFFFQVLPAIVSWTHDGAFDLSYTVHAHAARTSAFLPTVFNCRANLPFDLLSLSSLLATLAYSGRYLTIPLAANHFCVDFTIPRTAGPRRLVSHCSTLNTSILNCLWNPIAKCSLEALTGTLQMV